MTRRPAGVLVAALAGAALLPATADAAAPAGTGTALSLARAVRDVGIGGIVGLLVLLLVVRAPLLGHAPADRVVADGAGRLLRVLGVAGAVAALAAFVLAGAVAAGTGPGDALEPSALADTAGTRVGAWFLVSALAFAALATLAPRTVGAALAGRRATPAAGLVALLVVAPALGGSAVPSSPSWALIPIHVLHVAGMGAWFGGLAALVVVLPRALRAVPDGPPRLGLQAAVLLRFSPVALVSVAVLTAAGTGLAVLHLTTLYDLTDTAYGRAIVAKAALLVVAIVLAVGQREYLLPQLRRLADGEPPAEERPEGPEADEEEDERRPPSAAAPRHVRAALRAELGLLLAVLTVTGALAGYPPPRTLDTGRAVVVRTVGTVDLRATITPARPGRNVVELVVTDGSGRSVADVRGLRLRAVPPGRSGGSDVAVDVAVAPAGPGRLRASGVALDTRGGWTLEVRGPLGGGPRVATDLPFRVR